VPKWSAGLFVNKEMEMEIPYGYCHCNCGGKTKLAKQTCKSRGWVKGEPLKFITGHQNRGRFRPLPERFWEKVNKNGPMPRAEAVAVHPEIAGECCWIYGSDVAKRVGVWVDGRLVLAHRVAWFLETDRWPKPCCLHKCDRPGCVRFSHLFEGTLRANTKNMIDKERDAIVGERHSMATLTWADVREIRRLGQPCIRHPHKRGTILLKKRIAKRFGTTTDHIDEILENKIWKE
jgi:hypothetical protein